MPTPKESFDFDVTKWSCKKDGCSVNPFWMTLREASKACFELVKCGCKIKCSTRCRCKQHSLPCTELCGCGGGCDSFYGRNICLIRLLYSV